MSISLTKLLQAEMYRVLLHQFMIIMGITLIILLLKGVANGAAALAGACAYWLPTGAFILGVTKYGGARAALQFLAAFLVGETIKLTISGLLFIGAVNYFHLNLFYALLGLVGAIGAFWAASFIAVFRGIKI